MGHGSPIRSSRWLERVTILNSSQEVRASQKNAENIGGHELLGVDQPMTPGIATSSGTGKVAPYTGTCLCARARGACTWQRSSRRACVRAWELRNATRRCPGASSVHQTSSCDPVTCMWIKRSPGVAYSFVSVWVNTTGIVNELHLGTEKMRCH